jgi:hypothetical protein
MSYIKNKSGQKLLKMRLKPTVLTNFINQHVLNMVLSDYNLQS